MPSLIYPYNFYSCAIRPTAVDKCVSGHFTSEIHLNLIVAKNSRIEIFLVGPEGLTLMKEFNIYGKIEIMRLYRSPDEHKDLLFILTNRYSVMILEANGEDDNFEIHTRAHGNVADRIGKLSENGIIAVIDPEARVIGLRLYDGLLKIIPLERNVNELKVVNIRIEETEIQDLQFLHGCVNPTIILLHQDTLGRHIKTHELSLQEKEFIKIPWKQDNIEMESSMIIPVPEPLCGAIIIGQESVLYHDGSSFLAVNPHVITHSSINCYVKIDHLGHRYILGDNAGHLFILYIELLEKKDEIFLVKDIKVELIGEVSIPECITYLDNGVLFIGSRIGDSQLVRLSNGQNGTDSYITVLDVFNNLAPIIDMVVVDLEKQGQDQLITCSGGFKEGTLRIIRNGIGIQENANIELPGINGMWPLNINNENELDNILVLSFVGHTRVLSLGEEIEETEIFGFLSDNQTLFCSKIGTNVILQVVPSCIRVICLEPKQILSEWMPSSHRIISIVAANVANQLVCTSGNDIIYLEICDLEIIERKHITLDHEVSCVDISLFPEEIVAKYVAIGLWNDITIRILKLPSLEEIHREYLGGEIISRSILFANFEGMSYLFCALGDGYMFYFTFNRDNGELSEKRRVILGTQPIVLRSFKTSNMGTMNVFVCSDRPAVIHSSNRKLAFSNVNLKEVNCMCPLNCVTYQDSLAYANDNMLSIGTIDAIQKLHIRSVPLNEGPRRIAYQGNSQTFGVITTRLDVMGPSGPEIQRECASSRAQTFTNSNQSFLSGLKMMGSVPPIDIGTEVEIQHFLLFDQHTFEVLHAHQMLPTEYALSLISCILGNDPNPYYVVGTGLVNPDENEPKRGRIIIFQVDEGRLNMICEKEVKGGCYSLADFNGKLLASVNSAVRLFEWTSEKELRLECSHFNNIIALFVKTKGDFVLIGDLMRAITLLQYKSVEGSFEEIARDYNPNWMTAIEILDDDTFLGAENSLNLFICQKDSSATNDEDRQIMQEVAQFHLGDMVNLFRRGSLVMHPIGDSTRTFGSIIFGTVSGAVGVVTQIPREMYDLLYELEKRLALTIKSVGKIDHSFWRSFTSEVKTEPAQGFIDGELIESFLDLPRSDMENVVAGLKCSVPMYQIGAGDGLAFKYNSNEDIPKQEVSVDNVIKIVEDLTRLIH